MATDDNVNGAAVDKRDARDDKTPAANKVGTVDGGNGRGRVDDDDDLDTVLNLIKNNLKQLDENCCIICDRMNRIEMDCIDLLQPMGDIVSFEKQLERLSELESYLNEILRNDENN